MAGLIRNQLAIEETLYQREIADNIEDFMAGRFIVKCLIQGIKNTHFRNGIRRLMKSRRQPVDFFLAQCCFRKDERIVQITSFYQPVIVEIFDFMQETECFGTATDSA